MIDRSDISEMVERISDKVSCRARHRGLFYGLLGGALVVALVAVVWFVRRRRGEDEELLEQAETGWDGESLPDTFPDSMREQSVGDFGEGDDAAVPGNRARRTRRRGDTHGGLSSAEGDLAPA
jgi:hypothetical protein